MKLNTKDFLSILTQLKPGLGNRGTMEQFGHFIFTGADIATYSGNIGVFYPFESDFICSIVAEDMYRIVAGTKDISDVTVIHVQEKSTAIRSKGLYAQLNALVGNESTLIILHILERLENATWSPLPDNFLKGIDLCQFAVAPHKSYNYLTYLFIQNTTMLACDTKRVSQFILSGPMPRLLLEKRYLKEITKFPFIEYYMDDAFLFLKTKEGLRLAVRRNNENVDKFDEALVGSLFSTFNEDKQTIPFEFPDELLLTIDTLSSLAAVDAGKKHLDIVIEDGKLVCRAERESGKGERSMVLTYVGPKATFTIDPDLLKMILKITKKAILGLQTKRLFFDANPFYHIISITTKE